MGKVTIKNDTNQTWAVKVTYSKLNGVVVTGALVLLSGGFTDGGAAGDVSPGPSSQIMYGTLPAPVNLEQQSFLGMAREFCSDYHVGDVMKVLAAGHVSGNVSQMMNEWASDGFRELRPGAVAEVEFPWFAPGLKAFTFKRLQKKDGKLVEHEVHSWTPFGSVFDKHMSVRRETDPNRSNPFYYTKTTKICDAKAM